VRLRREYDISTLSETPSSAIAQQFIDAVTALGGRYEDESTSFEHLIAKSPF
jgi:hypothetical protein